MNRRFLYCIVLCAAFLVGILSAPLAAVAAETSAPRTITVHYDPNGGEGSMDPTVFTEGSTCKLTRCNFTRDGYTLEGWDTMPDGSGTHYADSKDISSLFTENPSLTELTLYAQWGSQVYFIHYSNGTSAEKRASITGTMSTQLAVHDWEVSLMPCTYYREGYTMTGWRDAAGVAHAPEESGINFAKGTSTTSWKLADIGMDLVRPNPDANWTCQGSVVYHNEDGDLCVAIGYVLLNESYTSGSLDNYDSEIMTVNLDTGELINHTSGLMLEHCNDIAFNPDNRHFYVAQGGLFDGFPNGIVELDEQLNEVRTITPEGTHHIWNISYHDGVFYCIGNVDGTQFASGNPNGDTSDLIRLDADLNVIDIKAIDYSGQGFTGQGLVCDGEYLYSILNSFHDQRLAIFTLDGEARGCQYLDIPYEVETASYLDGRMYFTVNLRTGSTVYGTDLIANTMTATWQANPYEIVFDANGRAGASMPTTISTHYDETVYLPDEEPVSPGQTFVSWNTKPDGSGETYYPGDSVRNLVSTGTITLYAQWGDPLFPLVTDNTKPVKGRRYRSKQQRQKKRELVQDKQKSASDPALEKYQRAEFACLQLTAAALACAFSTVRNGGCKRKLPEAIATPAT
ncbi:MAG: InlB B-repeat-containing protein [Coriobacteriales bacterium]|nr:InlB B-repeat-containing protein [Coriobacteriales bacterium]